MPPRARARPRHVRARLHRELRQRAVRARPHQRAARRERRRRLRDLARDVLRVAREQDHREAERHHDQRAGEHPLGESLRVDEQPRDDGDDDERRRVDRHRAQEEAAPVRSGIAGAVESDVVAVELPAAARRRSPAASPGSLARQRVISRASAGGQSGRSSSTRTRRLVHVRRHQLVRRAGRGRADGRRAARTPCSRRRRCRRDGRCRGSPAACSGAMYAGVPTAVPSCVSVAPAGFSCAAAIALAMPKSATTAVRPESRMLSGLMSRCTTPRSCA